ncbi:hypothetical protein AKJ08_3275 [Vulgatibacter incomptus]|uniref:Uncharacterized protein n=1 Tax=Vulgatibacter incomptus TaxID=1391653 RepID=A0A0K1PH73_9BACT|nr:hypothetical protein AKJ08_3275 [Vulgatibacter incomptus]
MCLRPDETRSGVAFARSTKTGRKLGMWRRCVQGIILIGP